MLWRNMWVIVVAVISVSAMAFGLYALQQPTFVSTARVLVQADQLGTPSFLSGIAAYRESQIMDPIGRKLETEMALILNRSNAAEVVQALHINASSLPASPLYRLMVMAVSLLQHGMGGSQTLAVPRSQVVDDFLATVDAEPVRSKTAETTSNVIEISVTTADPMLSTRALQGMLDAYLRLSTQQNRSLGTATRALLQSETSVAQANLKRVEDAIVSLAIRESTHPEFASSATAFAPGGDGQARRDTAHNVNETVTSQLVQQLMDLQAQLKAAQEDFTDETESVRKLQQRVDDVRARLATQMRTSATNSATYNQLERQRWMAQDHYIELRRKLDQIDLYMALTPAALDGRVVIDPPTRPDPSRASKKKLLILAGPVAGLLLGLLLAGLREFCRPRVRTRRDVSRLLAMPTLGSLPTFRGDDRLTATFSEAAQ